MATVPNYQGVFLRGFGSQVSTHYESVTHASAGLGALQGDAIRNIIADWEFVDSSMGTVGGAGAYGAARWHNTAVEAVLKGGSVSFSGGLSFNAARVVPTDVENRPVNIAVRYLIRAQK